MNLFVNAEPVMDVIDEFDGSDTSGLSYALRTKLEALAKANVCTLVAPHELVPVAAQNGKPLGDETMPTEARLTARLEAACRLIDSFNVYSIFSIRFVAEQQRFIKELRSKKT